VEVLDGSLTSNDIAAAGISGDRLATGTVTTTQIANSTILYTNLASATVSNIVMPKVEFEVWRTNALTLTAGANTVVPFNYVSTDATVAYDTTNNVARLPVGLIFLSAQVEKASTGTNATLYASIQKNGTMMARNGGGVYNTTPQDMCVTLLATWAGWNDAATNQWRVVVSNNLVSGSLNIDGQTAAKVTHFRGIQLGP
jgi:hypothetical protein